MTEERTRDIEAFVDTCPQSRTRSCPVTCEGIDASSCGGQGTNAREEEDTEDQKEQSKASTGRSSGCRQDQADGLAVRNTEQERYIRKDDEDGNQLNDSCGSRSCD